MKEISRLKQERLNRHWSRAQVEAKTGIPPRSLENWEEGTAWPRSENVELLCKLYGKGAEALGLYRSSDIMVLGNNAPTSQEGIAMSDLMRRAVFGDLGSKLNGLVTAWPRRNHHYEELQAEIDKTVLAYNAAIEYDVAYAVTRRDALQSLGLIAIQLWGGVAGSSASRKAAADTDTILAYCAAGIAAAWYLRRGSDLDFVSDLMSIYLSILQPLIYSHSEAHRKVGARLLAQCFMLQSHLGSEDELAFAERAIYYSDLSENPATQALAYRRRAYERWDIKNNKDALQDAKKGYGLARSNKATPKIIHSITAATLSLCQAANGHTEDARISLNEARTLFEPTIPVPSMSYTESILTAISGGVHQQIGLWGEATTLYEESLNIPDISALGYAQQRINYAKTEVSRDDKPRNMDLCIKLLTEAITRAEELNSTTYIRKAREVYGLLRIAWPREAAIKKLGEQF